MPSTTVENCDKSSNLLEKQRLDENRMAGTRSNVRTRSSGIPKSGSIKPPTRRNAKTKLPESEHINSGSANKSTAVARKDQQCSLSQQTSNVPSSLAKSLIRQKQSSPNKQIATKANKTDDNGKTKSSQSQESTEVLLKSEFETQETKLKNRQLASRSASTSLSRQPPNSKAAMNRSVTPLTGIGLGGGSVPESTFSYIASGLPVHQSKNLSHKTNSLQYSKSGLKTSSRINLKKRANSKSPERNLSLFEETKSTENREEKRSSKMTPKPKNFTGVKAHENSANSPKSFLKTPHKMETVDPPKAILSSTSPQQNNFDETKITSNRNILQERDVIKSSQDKKNELFDSRLNKSFKGNRPKAVSNPTVPCGNGSYETSKVLSRDEHFSGITSSPPLAKKHNGAAIAPKNDNNLSNVFSSSFKLPPQASSPIPKKINQQAIENQFPSPNNTKQPSLAKTKPQKEKKGLFGLSRSVRAKTSGSKADKTQTNKTASNEKSDAKDAILPVEVVKPKGTQVSFVSKLAKHAKLSPRSHQKSSKNNSMDKSKITSAKTSVSMDSAQTNTLNAPKTLQPTATPRTPINGIMSTAKNNGLMKTPSGSSIFTESSSSNVSSVPSSRTKKVSFQSDITVCDASGISTCSNGLRSPDLGHTSDFSLSEETVEEEVIYSKKPPQNLYTVVDQDFLTKVRKNENLLGRNTSSNQSFHSPVNQPKSTLNKYNYIHSYECNPYLTERQNPSNMTTFNSPKSAASLTQTEQSLKTVSPAPFHQRECTPFALSCESPVPFVVCQKDLEPVLSELTNFEITDPKLYPAEEKALDFHPSKVRNEQHSDLAGVVTEPSSSNNLVWGSVAEAKDLSHKDLEAPLYYECCESFIEGVAASNSIKDTNGHSIISGGDSVEVLLSKGGGKEDSNVFPSTLKENIASNQPANKRKLKVQTSVDQLNYLQITANGLKSQLKDLKTQHESNMKNFNSMFQDSIQEICKLISSASFSAEQSLQEPRTRVTSLRQAYESKSSLSEDQLTAVESAVDELRSDVVERRCLVNSKEVESLVKQLSEVGHTIAELKNILPTLKSKLQTAGAEQLDAIYADEKFLKNEPLQIDDKLKRCRQLTSTLLTLKKLATVQEARSSTPLSMQSSTSDQRLVSPPDEAVFHKKHVSHDVQNLRVNHQGRAENVKTLQQDRAMNRSSAKNQYVNDSKLHMYPSITLPQGTSNEDNIALEYDYTASETSSVDSLPPPPAGLHPENYPSGVMRGFPDLRNTSWMMQHSSPASVLDYHSPNRLPLFGSSKWPPHQGYSGTLPSRSHSVHRPPQYAAPLHPQAPPLQNLHSNDDLAKPPLVERSRSVPPHMWNPRPAISDSSRKTSLSYQSGNASNHHANSMRTNFSDV